MPKLIECVPNFSEGRDREILGALEKEAQSLPGVTLLDYSGDADHNRSVFTLLGDPAGIAEGAFRLCKLAALRIDLTKHRGEHPRMGAADVIPFIPIRETTMAECADLARQTAERIARELGIPAFLYGEAALKPERRNLEDIRRGQFEGMPEKLLRPEWTPDFGEPRIHPTAGVTAVGARMPLIAFNVNLGTSDIRIARAIARNIRGS